MDLPGILASIAYAAYAVEASGCGTQPDETGMNQLPFVILYIQFICRYIDSL